MAWMLQLLGPPCWFDASAEGAARAIAPIDSLLLCLLAVRGASERKAIAAALWPRKDEAARNQRQHLFQIRRIAGDEVVVGNGVLMLSPACSVDLLDAPLRLAADARALPGELLQGVTAPGSELQNWLDDARAQWRHRLSGWLAEGAQRAAAAGRYDDALPYAMRLVEQWPDDEAHYHRLMQLHYLDGAAGVALEVFRRC